MGAIDKSTVTSGCIFLLLVAILIYAIQIGVILLVWNYLLVPFLHWTPIGLFEAFLVSLLFNFISSLFRGISKA